MIEKPGHVARFFLAYGTEIPTIKYENYRIIHVRFL